MGLVRWAKKTIDRNRRSRKAISTIMANLTMLVIVVVLSSLLFVWAISSFGAYQGGAGYWFSSRSLANQERMSIEGAYLYSCTGGSSCSSTYCTSGSQCKFALVYVRNVGTIPFTVASVYINQTIYGGFSGACSGSCDFQLLQYNVSQVVPVGVPLSQASLPNFGNYPGLCMSGACLGGKGLTQITGSWTITVATTRGTVTSTTVVF